MLQCAKKGGGGSMYNTGFKILKTSAFQMFYEEGNTFETFIRHQGCKQCVMMSNTEWD